MLSKTGTLSKGIHALNTSMRSVHYVDFQALVRVELGLKAVCTHYSQSFSPQREFSDVR